ncbi:MAG: hypothetical protein ACE5GX_20420 [Thermoanaerobaculia bacterium]
MSRKALAVFAFIVFWVTATVVGAARPASFGGTVRIVEPSDQLRDLRLTVNHVVPEDPNFGDSFDVVFQLAFPNGTVFKRIRAEFSATVLQANGTRREVGGRIRTGRKADTDRMLASVGVMASECRPECTVIGTFRVRGGALEKFLDPRPTVVIATSVLIDPSACRPGERLENARLHFSLSPLPLNDELELGLCAGVKTF